MRSVARIISSARRCILKRDTADGQTSGLSASGLGPFAIPGFQLRSSKAGVLREVGVMTGRAWCGVVAGVFVTFWLIAVATGGLAQSAGPARVEVERCEGGNLSDMCVIDMGLSDDQVGLCPIWSSFEDCYAIPARFCAASGGEIFPIADSMNGTKTANVCYWADVDQLDAQTPHDRARLVVGFVQLLSMIVETGADGNLLAHEVFSDPVRAQAEVDFAFVFLLGNFASMPFPTDCTADTGDLFLTFYERLLPAQGNGLCHTARFCSLGFAVPQDDEMVALFSGSLEETLTRTEGNADDARERTESYLTSQFVTPDLPRLIALSAYAGAEECQPILADRVTYIDLPVLRRVTGDIAQVSRLKMDEVARPRTTTLENALSEFFFHYQRAEDDLFHALAAVDIVLALDAALGERDWIEPDRQPVETGRVIFAARMLHLLAPHLEAQQISFQDMLGAFPG
ncbi:MAG: hypothetical protein AAGL89_06210 [Pseudomonadota bacterium]